MTAEPTATVATGPIWPDASERIMVPFHGEGVDADVEEMSWGQWEIWIAMCDQQSSLAIGGARALFDGETIESVAAELGWILGRYPTMRTRLRFRDSGRPLQVLSASGEIPLEIFDAADEDPGKLADRIYSKYERNSFDYVTEWPMRMGLVRHRGVATHMAVAMCHIAASG